MGILLDLYNKQREEEEARRSQYRWAYQQAQRKQLDEQSRQPQKRPEERPNILKQVASDIATPFRNIAQGAARSLGAGRETTGQKVASQSLQMTQQRVIQLLKDPSISQARKDLLMGMLNEQNRETVKKATENTRTVESQTDKSKFLGSVAEAGSYFVGGGSIPAAFKAGKAVSTAAKITGAGAVGGAGYELARNEDPTMGGVITSTAIGAGGALGGSLALSGVAAGARATGRGIKNLDQAAARAGSKNIDRFLATTPGQKVNEVIKSAQKKLQNTTAPINQELNRLAKNRKLSEAQVKNVKSLIQTSRYSSNGMAEAWMKGQTIENIGEGSKFASKLFEPLDGQFNPDKPSKMQKNFLDYWAKRGELEQARGQAARGKKVSEKKLARLEEEATLLDQGDFAQRYEASVGAYEELADLMVKHGLESAETVNYWRSTNQLYNRIQRNVEGMSEMTRKGGSRAPASRGSSVGDQKVKGSNKEVVNPALTFIDHANTVFREINSNRAASALIDALQEAGALGKGLRVAEKVLLRQDLFEALKYSRPLKKQLDRFAKTQGKYVRQIQGEVDKLNRAGLRESLSAAPEDNLAGKLVDPSIPMNKQELQSVLDNLIQTTDSATLNKIRKTLGKREPKLAKAIEELEDIRSTLNAVNGQRKAQFDEILKNADDKVNSRPTIQRRVNGIKEIFETTPEIEMAAKGFGPVYMGTLGRIVAAPVRFMQTTITGGLNPAWAAVAVPRDFIEGVVLSRYARQTHNPMNVIATVAEAAGKNSDEMFQKFMSYERGASSVIDLTNTAKSKARIAREVSRQQLPKTTRVASVVRSPSDFWNRIQEASKWNEYVAKYQSFRGSYNKLINDGVNPEEAFNIALYEGRNATGNLLEQGDWTRALAAVYPFFNPTIQGGASLARALKNRPIATSAKIVMAVQMPAVISTAWNMSDPRRAEIYLDISAADRERYNILVLPGSEKTNGKWSVVKMPKAPGVGSLANPIERLMVQMYGQDPGEFENFAQSIIKSIGSPIDPGSVSQAVGSALPFQAKVPTQQVANHSFYTGKEIVPDWIKDQNPDEPFKQAYANTSTTYKKLGKALGISPLLVEQFAKDTTGEFGRNATYMSDYAFDLIGQSESDQRGGRSPLESVTRAYYGAYGGVAQREVNQQLSKIIDTKPRISSQINDALESGDLDTANRLALEHNNAVEEFSKAMAKDTDLKKLTEKQRKLLETMKFPIENNRLTQRSINARLKN